MKLLILMELSVLFTAPRLSLWAERVLCNDVCHLSRPASSVRCFGGANMHSSPKKRKRKNLLIGWRQNSLGNTELASLSFLCQTFLLLQSALLCETNSNSGGDLTLLKIRFFLPSHCFAIRDLIVAIRERCYSLFPERLAVAACR